MTGSTTTRLVATLGATYNTNQTLGHTDVVISVVSVAPGVVVSGARDDVAIVWQRATGAATYTLARQLVAGGSGDVTALAVLPSNRQQVNNALVAAGCADGRVRYSTSPLRVFSGVLSRDECVASVIVHNPAHTPMGSSEVYPSWLQGSALAYGTTMLTRKSMYTEPWGPRRRQCLRVF